MLETAKGNIYGSRSEHWVWDRGEVGGQVRQMLCTFIEGIVRFRGRGNILEGRITRGRGFTGDNTSGGKGSYA